MLKYHIEKAVEGEYYLAGYMLIETDTADGRKTIAVDGLSAKDARDMRDRYNLMEERMAQGLNPTPMSDSNYEQIMLDQGIFPTGYLED